jgi:hypothetical protein
MVMNRLKELNQTKNIHGLLNTIETCNIINNGNNY